MYNEPPFKAAFSFLYEKVYICKMKTKFTYILIIILALTYSCHKYDENTLLFKKPEKYLFGNRTIANYYVDGINKTDVINQKIIYFWFSSNDEHPYFYDLVVYTDPDTISNTGVSSGNWRLIDKKKKINLNLKVHTTNIPSDSIVDYFLFHSTEWDIIKLKEFDIKLEADYNSHHYQLELVPK